MQIYKTLPISVKKRFLALKSGGNTKRTSLSLKERRKWKKSDGNRKHHNISSKRATEMKNVRR
jgi:hypothetical protein